VSRIIPDNLGDQSSLDLVSQWLQKCLDTHEVDRPLTPPLPTRVIEIVDDHIVKLVHTDGKPGLYFALSHNWSSDPKFQPTQTKRDNIKRHMEGLLTSSLSKTYRETI
jgi:hypothetical protein